MVWAAARASKERELLKERPVVRKLAKFLEEKERRGALEQENRAKLEERRLAREPKRQAKLRFKEEQKKLSFQLEQKQTLGIVKEAL